MSHYYRVNFVVTSESVPDPENKADPPLSNEEATSIRDALDEEFDGSFCVYKDTVDGEVTLNVNWSSGIDEWQNEICKLVWKKAGRYIPISFEWYDLEREPDDCSETSPEQFDHVFGALEQLSMVLDEASE